VVIESDNGLKFPGLIYVSFYDSPIAVRGAVLIVLFSEICLKPFAAISTPMNMNNKPLATYPIRLKAVVSLLITNFFNLD